MKKLLYLLMFTLAGSGVSAQDLVWAKQMGGVDPDVGYSVAVGQTGNVFTAGTFFGNIDFDPGGGVFILSGGGMFIQKLNANGDLKWARRFPGEAYAITVDSIDNVYVTGLFAGTVDFDPGSGVFNLTSLYGGDDVFVLKMDSAANFIWAKSLKGTQTLYFTEIGCNISTDNAGNVFVCGSFKDTVDFDPGTGTHYEISGPSRSTFVLKLDSGGGFDWVKQFPTMMSWITTQIAFGSSGEIYVSGADNSTIYKLDASSNVLWSKPLQALAHNMCRDLFGNTYICGGFAGTVDFDPSASIFNVTTGGGIDIFVLKLDAQDNFVWAKKMGGAGNDYALSINADATGNIYVTGNFVNTADFDPAPGSCSFTANGGIDMFLLKLNGQGDFLSAKQFSGSGSQYAESSTIDNTGNVFITGYFQDTTDFDPGLQNYNLTSNGYDDIFILKLSSTLNTPQLTKANIPILIYPNPTTKTIHISSQENIEKILVTDVLGKKVYEAKPGKKNTDLDIEIPGIYFITTTDPSGNNITQRVVVSR